MFSTNFNNYPHAFTKYFEGCPNKRNVLIYKRPNSCQMATALFDAQVFKRWRLT